MTVNGKAWGREHLQYLSRVWWESPLLLMNEVKGQEVSMN